LVGNYLHTCAPGNRTLDKSPEYHLNCAKTTAYSPNLQGLK